MSDEIVELNIKKIVTLFYNNILVSLIIIIFSLAVGFFIYQNTDDAWTGELRISKIDQKEKSKYDEFIIGFDNVNTKLILNRLPSHEFIKDDNIDNIFLRYFYDEINDRDEIIKYFKDQKIYDKNNFSPKEYEELLSQVSHNVKLNPKYTEMNEMNILESFDITYSSNSTPNIKNLIESILILVNKNVEEQFKNLIMSRKTLTEKLIESKSTDIKNEILLSTEDYKDELEIRILFLEEQSQIARSINLENNQLTQNIILDEFKTDDNAFKPPYYLRGYKAIEKEIEIIRKRIKNNATPDEVLIQKSDLRKLSALKDDLIYFDLYLNTPLNNGNFKATNYDLGSINYTNDKLSLMYHLIISFSISLILLSIYLLYIWLKEDN